MGVLLSSPGMLIFLFLAFLFKESPALILLCGNCCGAMGIMKMELKVGELQANICMYVGFFSGWRRQFNDSNYFFKWAAA